MKDRRKKRLVGSLKRCIAISMKFRPELQKQNGNWAACSVNTCTMRPAINSNDFGVFGIN